MSLPDVMLDFLYLGTVLLTVIGFMNDLSVVDKFVCFFLECRLLRPDFFN